MATLVNSLRNKLAVSLHVCITLNANTGKTVLVKQCIQIEWLLLLGVKLSHESGADSIEHGARGPTFTNAWARGAPRVEQKTRK